MFDLVTVVFKDELPILKVQAQSISQYCKQLPIRNIYVVVNDLETLVERIDPAWWYQYRSCVKIVHRDMFGADLGSNGWVSQQVLKLLTAAVSHNEWSLVLDAKTVFVKPVDPTLLLDAQGRAQTGLLPIFPVFEQCQHRVQQLFGIQMLEQIGPGGPPFLFKNHVVREMISDIEHSTKQDFCEWFLQQGIVTEFMLYSGYVIKKFRRLDALYVARNPEFAMEHVCHSQVNSFDLILDRAESTTPLTVSVHRGAWAQLTDQQQQRYRNYLQSRSLGKAMSL